VALSKFDPNAGILVGARVSATIPVTLTAQVTAINSLGSNNRSVDTTVTYTGGVSATGLAAVSAQTPITLLHSCNGANCLQSPSNQSQTSPQTIFSASGTVNSASLASYYGTSPTPVQISTSGLLSVSTTTGTNLGTGFGLGIVNRTAGSSYSIAYDYLNFAQPSFNGSTVQPAFTLDFGTRFINSGPVTLNFTLYNIGNQNSAGFDVLSVTPENGNPLFTTTLTPFTNSVAGGASRSFSATFDPNSLGGQIDKLRIIARDSAADVGDGIGAREYVLELSLAGLVALPDPATWMTMIAGFGFVGGAMRRRRAIAA
jgi:hypothetical protein